MANITQYQKFNNKKLGEVCFVRTTKHVIGNCFSQKLNFDTDYEALPSFSRILRW